MFTKVAVIVCGQMLLVNIISAQYITGAGAGYGSAGCCGASPAPINAGCAPITTSGGGFIVSSSSPINPSGLYVISENTIDGKLGVNGQIPFLGAVSLEADVPSNGNTAVAYKCGDCEIGITAERQGAPAGPCCGAGLAGAGYGAPTAGLGYGAAGAGLGYSAAGAGLGYGLAGGLGYGAPAAGIGYGAAGAGLGYGAAGTGLGYGAAGAGLGYGAAGAGLGAGLGAGYGAGYGYGLGPAAY